MTEMQIAMVQDASKDAALAGLSLRQIVAKAGAASIAQTPCSTEMFARLADGDTTGIGPLFIPPRIRGDGKAEVSAFGACMGDAIAETDVAILSSEKIAPGDLCQLVVRGASDRWLSSTSADGAAIISRFRIAHRRSPATCFSSAGRRPS